MAWKDENGKPIFSFSNILALIVVTSAIAFLFVAVLVLRKSDIKDNTMLSQITTGMISAFTFVLAYYFGSSSASAKQAQQITDLQKTVVTTANNANNSSSNTDKAMKIGELKKALEGLEPDSEDAKKILAELTDMEKQA